MKYNSLANLLNQNVNDINMDFCGSKVNIPAEMYIFSCVTLKYVQLAQDAALKYSQKIKNLFNSELDSYKVSSDFLDIFIECSMLMINEISKDAISVDIYTLDKQTIINYCDSQNCFKELYEYRNSLYNKAYELSEKYANECVSREFNKANRPKLQQVTISNKFSDFAKNQFKVDVINAGVGIGYNFINSIKNKMALEKIKSEFKAYVINSMQLLSDIATSAYARIAGVIIDFIVDEIKIPGFKENVANRAKADSIYNNIRSLQLPIKRQYELARQVIQFCPYEKKFYEDFFERFPKYQLEIFLFAQKFNIDFSDKVILKVEKYVDVHLNDSLLSMKECENYINYVVSNYNIKASILFELLYKIQEKKQRLLTKSAMDVYDNNSGDVKKAISYIDQTAHEYGIGVNPDISKKEILLRNRTINGIVIPESENIEKIKEIASQYPYLFTKDYNFKNSNEINEALVIVENIIKPLDKKLAYFFETELKQKYNNKVEKEKIEEKNNRLNNLLNNPPEMIYHRDYEEYIEKLQEFSESEKAIDKAYVYEIKLQHFESDCNIANFYNKYQEGQQKNNIWWFNISEFVSLLISVVFFEAIIISLFSFSKYDSIWTLFTMPITYLIAMPIAIFIALSTEYSAGDNSRSKWNKLTCNGKYTLQEISAIKNTDRKKAEMPKFENGVVKIVKLPDNHEIPIEKNTKLFKSVTIAHISKNEYVGIISVKGIFYHVKYYNETGVYCGYVLKKYLDMQNVQNKSNN